MATSSEHTAPSPTHTPAYYDAATGHHQDEGRYNGRGGRQHTRFSTVGGPYQKCRTSNGNAEYCRTFHVSR